VAFTYDLTTDIGKVRLKLTDTRVASAWFTDGEIQLGLLDGGSVNGAVVYLARVLLMDKARRGSKWSNTEGSYDDTSCIGALKELIVQYGGAGDILPSVSVTFPSLLPMDSGYTEG
jgi:hypothetical protein